MSKLEGEIINVKLIAVLAVVALVGASAGAYLYLNSDDGDKKRSLGGNTPLEVFGNADGDYDIDEDDVKFIERIIAGEEEESEFADANHDGKIDQADVVQTRKLANNTAEYVCLIDGYGGFKRVNTDPQRIAVDQIQICEYTKIMGVGDRVVCGDFPASILDEFYFDQEVVSIGGNASPDYEKIINLDIDMYLVFFSGAYEEKVQKLVGVDVLYLGMYSTDTLDLENSSFVQAILKGGYVFNNTERAESYVEWMLDLRDAIRDVTSTIAKEDRKNVLISNYSGNYWADENTLDVTVYMDGDTLGQAAILAGARLAGEGESSYGTGGLSIRTNVEWLLEQELDFLFLHTVRLQGNGNEVLIVPKQGYLEDNRDEFIKKEKEIAGLEYVKMVDLNEDNIFMQAGDFRNNASSGLLYAAYMCKIIYPELFEDFDPYEVHNQYMGWMGFPEYDTREHGTFIAVEY